MARLTDLIIVDTESVRSDGLREHVVNAPEKLVTVPMGLDLQKFSPSKSGPGNLRAALGVRPLNLVVGTVARLVPDKGMDCWKVTGTKCNLGLLEKATLHEKIECCRSCDFYKAYANKF